MRRPMRLIGLAFLLLAAGIVPADDLVEAGRRIYEDGLLPGGSPLIATRPEGLYLEGRYAACVSCHRRSGMGSIEGAVDAAILVPPLAGPLLFAPARFTHSFLDETHHYVPHVTWRRAMTRPAYEPQGFAAALREGVNSAGQPLDAPMPYYDLDDAASAALLAYLGELTSAPDPGVDDDKLHLATIITPDAHPDDVAGVLGVLRVWAGTAAGIGKPWTLHEWRLEGPPATWRAQLEKAYADQPVFAALSGAGDAEWQPVHRFCEAHALPCILPSVYAAPRDLGGWYSVYFSPGIELEAQILARHLATQDAPLRIVQAVADDVGRRAADRLAQNIASAGIEVRTRRFHMTAPGGLLADIGTDDVLVLWLRSAHLEALARQSPDLPAARTIYASALLSAPEEAALPPSWRPRLRFVTLFDDLGLQADIARLRLARWLRQNGLDLALNRRAQADAYAAAYLFNEALAQTRLQEIRRPPVPLSREHVLEILEDLVAKYADGTRFVDTESHVAWYGRMSLGPRQRIAARGGTVVRYLDRETARLVAVSERIVPR